MLASIKKYRFSLLAALALTLFAACSPAAKPTAEPAPETAAPTVAPQLPQKAAPSTSAVPQLLQDAGCLAPQWTQNCRPAAISPPQAAQRTSAAIRPALRHTWCRT